MTAPSTDAYTAQMQDYRRRKDAFFASGRGPVKGEALEGFGGLSYYPPDAAWRFAVLVARLEGESVLLGTSTGEMRPFIVYGTVQLPLLGGSATMAVYATPGTAQPSSLFVPFRDATSGDTTYGAGRYLDAPLQGGQLVLDFNLAYHPYCAYGEGWTCPLPPAQNVLAVAVEAGERLPDKE